MMTIGDFMKYSFLFASVAMTVMLAAPVYALRVTNLDSVAHTVELAGSGATQQRVIEPNATEYFTGAAHGRLSLVEVQKKGKVSKKIKPAPMHDSVLHADGLLSGIIGNERSTNIPADPDSDYTIWPGGHLNVQSRSKNGGHYF
jgi:hypothetical protein